MVEGQPEHRDGGHQEQVIAVAQVPEQAAQHILRVAHQRRHAAGVRAGGEREQKWQRR